MRVKVKDAEEDHEYVDAASHWSIVRSSQPLAAHPSLDLKAMKPTERALMSSLCDAERAVDDDDDDEFRCAKTC